MNRRTRGQRWYAKHREVIKAKTRAYRAANLEKCRAISKEYTSRPDVKEYRRLRTYGLTVASYQTLLDKQNNACAICFTPFIDLSKRHIHIDHDHLLDKVRGILCHICNLGVGNFKDDPARCDSATNYLRKNS